MLKPKSISRFVVGLVLIFLSVVIIYAISYRFIPSYSIPITISFSTCIIIYLIYRWRIEPPAYDYELRNLRAINLLSPLISDIYLDIDNFYSLEFESLIIIINKIIANNCNTIVECGSGISTVIIGSLLKQRNKGHLYSLEHQNYWCNYVNELINQKALQDYVTIIYAPLSKYRNDNILIDWYDLDNADNIKNRVDYVDLLLVDGPLTKDTYTRYPALPYFKSILSKDSLIILDDVNRSEEMELLSKWENDFNIQIDIERSTRHGLAYIRIIS